MSLFSLAFAGGSFILIGSWESLSSPISSPPQISPLSLSKPPPPSSSSSQQSPSLKTQRFSTITLISTFALSLLFIFNSLFSLLNSINSKDNLGPSLQLQVLAISSLFLMFSLLGLFTNFSNSKTLSFPYPLINLVLLFAFVEEFLLFYLHLKDPKGIENRYYDLMLVPISICVFSTLIELKNPNSNVPRLGRGVGLILQGTWFVQMGLSFYTDLIAHNCTLLHKSRGNFTIKCLGHMDSHRGGAIAVLLFNCHLALLVAVIAGVYSVFGKRFVHGGDYRTYRPIGGVNVMERVVENEGQFTLDSDSDDGANGIDEIKQEEGSSETLRRGNGSVELVVNGFGSHR